MSEIEDVGWTSVAELHAAYVDALERWELAATRAERAEAAAARVRALHTRHSGPTSPWSPKREGLPHCGADGETWPCRTIAALDDPA